MLLAPGVSQQRLDELIAAARREFEAYGIEVVVPWVHPWSRVGFTYHEMIQEVASHDLETPCDRLMAFVDRSAADTLWGALMPEVLGAVDEATHTRGFVFATQSTPTQLLLPPSDSTVHEFYHFLGCEHALSLEGCYTQIATLKQRQLSDANFLPSTGADGRVLQHRFVTNMILRTVIAAQRVQKALPPANWMPYH